MTPRQQWEMAFSLYRSLQYRGTPWRSLKIPGRLLMACNYAYLSRGDKLADRRPGYMLKQRRPMPSPVYIDPIFNCRCTTARILE